jgi:hypothetical protein
MARIPSKLLESVLEERVANLEEKLAFLWRMVIFLSEHPGYKVNDYLMERSLEVAALTRAKEPAL